MDRRRTGLVIAGGIALLALAPTPTADIRIETHALADLSPHRVQAALDLGVIAVNLLVTWSDTVRGD